MYNEVKLPSHGHPLYRSNGFNLYCNGCNRRCYNDDGYRCKECYRGFFLHKECAESPTEINHPCHPQHPLRLNRSIQAIPRVCGLCGKNLRWLGYECELCRLFVHTGCARNPPTLVIERPRVHHHFLTLKKASSDFPCHVCCGRCKGYHYECHQCDLFFHIKCVNLSPEINHPSHPTHPLKLLTDGAPNSADNKCCLCGERFKHGRLYRCSFCGFSIDLRCARDPPPVTLLTPKTHNHELTAMPRLISFTCNACGDKGDRNPYVCLQCNFVIHRDCIDLPHVVRTNRHDHRISLTYLLGARNPNSACRICCKTVDGAYGAYSCLVCNDYVIHSRCVVKRGAWDGRELEGEPEEYEDIEPFKRIANDTIIHFSHESHSLVLNRDGTVRDENIHCKACIRPIYLDPSYACSMQDCDFILHETCASLPRKKWHVMFMKQLTLIPGSADKSPHDSFICRACGRLFTGFKYGESLDILDVRCASICEPLHHKSHPHALYYAYLRGVDCSACGREGKVGMTCLEDGCGFGLDFGCIVLSEQVKHKCDEHTLFLRYGEEEEEARGEYWCDVCEEVMDPKMWFYTCDDCGTTLHIDCVRGDFGSAEPGTILWTRWGQCEVVPNNDIHRPRCCHCEDYCKFPNVLKVCDDTGRYVCSHRCAKSPDINAPMLRSSRAFRYSCI